MKAISFAIIGGGPAAFYTAKLLSSLPCEPHIHIIEQELCPFGLIRYGVAPDHISIKKAEITLSKVHNYPLFRMIGNMKISSTQLPILQEQYSGIIHAYGASGDYNPGWQFIQGKSNVYFARKIVYWYNNHPSMEDIHLQLSHVQYLTIVGNGNVAIDIARIMLRNVKDLQHTEISLSALQDLKNNRIQTVNIIGRRGSTHSAFALKQLRQLSRYQIMIYAVEQQLQASMNQSSYYQCTALGNHLSSAIRVNKRKLDYIKQKVRIIKREQLQEVSKQKHKKIILRYLLMPINYNGQQLTCRRMKLQGKPFHQQAKPINNQQCIIPTDMLVISTGFQVQPLHEEVNSNCKNILHSNGCLLKEDGNVDIGHYTVGWCKNGARGVIDETLLSCEETFNNIRIHTDKGLLVQKMQPETHNKDNTVSFQQYLQLKNIQLSRGDQKTFIKKKMNVKEIQQLYAIHV